jgi:cobalt-zinc-cadmium efflux system outer membrane protein
MGDDVPLGEVVPPFLRVFSRCATGVSLVALGVGCSTVHQPAFPVHTAPAVRSAAPRATTLVQAQAVEPPPPAPTPADVNGLVQSAVTANPRLARANALVEAARGRFVQAGLRPNPVFAFNADELGDRTGPMGLLSPSLSQEFVLGGKLSLAQAVAAKEIDQATLDALGQRYAVAGAVRAAAYELAALRQRQQVLGEVVGIAEKSVEQATKAERAVNATLTRGDVLPLELELERFKTEQESLEREIPAAERRLAALVGDARMAVGPFAAELTAPLPDYQLDSVRDAVVAYHPEVRGAAVAVERAQAAVRRAEAELIPNVTGSIGYVRQNQNQSNDLSVGVSVPLVVNNRNQGNIRAARAEVAAATLEITRVQNDLADRVATAFRTYAAAKARAERYRDVILKKADENYEFVRRQLDKGVVEYLRVLQAQRAVAEAKLEYNRAVGEAWRAAGELSGLLMEETFPAAPPPR